MEKKKKKSFLKLFRDAWDKYVRPGEAFERVTWTLTFKDRHGRDGWRVSRTLWNNASLSDLKAAFGPNIWVGFTMIPRHLGEEHAVMINDPVNNGMYRLFKVYNGANRINFKELRKKDNESAR